LNNGYCVSVLLRKTLIWNFENIFGKMKDGTTSESDMEDFVINDEHLYGLIQKLGTVPCDDEEEVEEIDRLNSIIQEYSDKCDTLAGS